MGRLPPWRHPAQQLVRDRVRADRRHPGARGGDQDLAQLGRCAGVIKQIREGGNSDLKMAVLFTAARETSRDRAAEKAVRSCVWRPAKASSAPRSSGTVIPMPTAEAHLSWLWRGPAALEMQGILTGLSRLIPAHLLANTAAVQAA